MSEVSLSYARALFDIAQERKDADVVLSQYMEVCKAAEESGDFLKFLAAPTITKADKTRLIDKTFGQNLEDDLLNYLKVMIERGDASEIVSSFEDFEKLYNLANNIEKVTAITVVPMSAESKERLCKKLENLTGKKIVLTNKISESCLGGVILEFGEIQLDDSIASKLEDLKNKLKGDRNF
jgi:F-type H+-transporting ATPase subunit delta